MYHYHIAYWDSLDCEIHEENGLVAVSSYKNAMEVIVETYGEENISEIKITRIQQLLTDEELEDIIYNK